MVSPNQTVESSQYLYHLTTIDYCVIVGYMTMLLSVGIVFKRFCSNLKDYFVGGNKVTWWLGGLSCFVMSFSAWTFTGGAGSAYKYGILMNVIFATIGVAYLLAGFLTSYKCRQSRAFTYLQIVHERFGRAAEQFFTWIGIPMGLFGCGIWLNSVGVFVSVGFGVPVSTVIIVSGILILACATIAGSWGVIGIDFVQGIVMLALTIVLAALTFLKIGGLPGVFANISPEHFRITDVDHSAAWVIGYSAMLIVGFNSISMAQRYLAVKDGKSARRVAFTAGTLYLIIPTLWFLPPLAASYFFPHIDKMLPQFTHPEECSYVLMGLNLLPHGLSAMLMMIIFAATLSSMDVGLNMGAGIITMNMYKPLFRPNASPRELFIVGHIFTVLSGTLSIYIALLFAGQTKLGLFDLMVFLQSCIQIPLSVPFVLIYWVRKAPKWSAMISAIAGFMFSMFSQHGMLIKDSAGCFFCKIADTIGITKFAHWEFLNTLTIGTFEPHQPWHLGLQVFGAFFIGTVAFMVTIPFWKFTSKEDKERIAAFYTKMNTPIDVEKEVVGSEDLRQLLVVGTLLIIIGCAVMLLVFAPDNWTGRFTVMAVSGIILAFGTVLRFIGKRSKAKLEAIAAQNNNTISVTK